jgi:site-specific DNA recombinase
MRIAVYYRVSKDKKGGVSIDVQRAECERYIAQHHPGAIILPAYIDDGKSAFTDKIEKRPAFQRLINDAAARVFDLVVVYKLDRFARKRAVYFSYLDLLKDKYKIEVNSATESNEWLSVGFNGLMAEHYSRMLSARMKDVRRWEQRQGLHVGPVPVGYDRTRGVLTPNDEAEGVRELGRLYATGRYSHVALSVALNERGYTIHGKRYTDSAIKEILRCEVYAGRVAGQPGAHEPIWAADLWQRIQAVYAERASIHPHEGRHYALLGGVARCALCGGSMVYNVNTATPTYRCRVSNRRLISHLGMTCKARKAHAEVIEHMVLAWLGSLALLPDLLPRARRLLEIPPPRSGPSAAEIEQKLRRLARAYADGAYSDDEYSERRAHLLGQLATAEQPEPHVSLDDVAALLSDLPTLLREAPGPERQALMQQLVSAVYIARRDVYAIRPTHATALFFRAVEPDVWLKAAHMSVRCASSEETREWLRKPPIILAAA